MTAIKYNCPNCGGTLIAESEKLLRCPYCESTFENDSFQRKMGTLREFLDMTNMETVHKQRRNLYQAVYAKYIDDDAIRLYANEIKKLLPDDFQANFYLEALSGDPKKTARLIREINVAENHEQLTPIIHFLIASFESDYHLALSDLIERAYKKHNLELFSRYASELENEACKVNEGVYDTFEPRDVFIAHSSKDMDAVMALCEDLELNGFTCFVAERNLRHGAGAVQNYERKLEEAMENCSCFLLVSSEHSRFGSCGAVKKEIPYIRSMDIRNAPEQFRYSYAQIPEEYKMPRIEYRIGTSTKSSRTVIQFFEGYEWVYTPMEIMDRLDEIKLRNIVRKIDWKEKSSCAHQNVDIIPAVQATCSEGGKTEGARCADCGEILRQPVPTPPRGHRFGDWTITTPATCTKNGVQERVCDCGEKEMSPVRSLGRHITGDWETVREATHETDGLRIRKCLVCDKKEEERIPAKGHKFGAWTVVNPATCIKEGLRERTCDCGKKEIQTVPSLGAHQPGEWEIAKEPTEKEAGLKVRKCTVCGKRVASENIPKKQAPKTVSLSAREMNTLGNKYYYGKDGVAQDNKKAFECYAKAAEQGHVVAQFNLAFCYANGRGVERNDKKAVEWYTKAAEQGHITSQFNLAVRYANGRGVERNDKKAVEWYTKAAEQGDNDAKKELEKLQKKRTISNDVSKGSDYKANTDGKTCKHEPVITPAQSPTCTKPGITEASVCKLCGTTLKEAQPIPPTGHRFGVWQTVKEATCTEDGLQKRRCDCGKEETKPIPAHGAHTPGEWMTVKEPTENETGLKVRTCSVCGTRTEEEKIPALPILQANPGTQETSVSEGLSYEVNPDDETCSVTGQGTCKDRHIVIPETIDGYRVTGIITKTKGVSGFKPYIKSVSIPNSVMSIGESAFEDSVNLKSVLIPDSVTSIGESAFSRCKSLASVVIPDFVKSIGEKTFYCCTSLASVVIPGSVTNIGDEAFYYCQSLASVVIADSVKSIDDQVFHGLGNLASVVIPESVTSIGHSAFYGCTRLTRAVIPKSVTRIGSWAFRGCTSLVSVIIPDSVMHIGECAFWDCTSLASVEIPKSVTSIDEAAFIGVGGISVSVDNLSYRSIDGNLYTKDGRTLLYYAANKKNTTFIIPDSVTHIGERALQRCRNLVSVVIPDSVWSIGTLAFYDCTSLASVVIPDSVKSIGKSAFSGCTSLASVVIPDSITSIGNWAFNDCTSLASVVIPDSVWSIGEYAFCDCTGLASAVISDSVTSIDERAFKGCKSLASLRYTGTKAQWNQIVLGSDWKQNTLLRAVECTDGTIPFS